MRRGFRRQGGQVIVLMALMIIVLTGAVGIGIDAGFGYIYSAACERAAAAGALAGVVFMPDQFDSTKASPAGSRNDATDRAIDEAKKNGFDVANTTDNVQVTVAAVAGAGNKLQVTVSRTVRTTFMSIFGLSSYTVSRTAIASYLPPLSVGQPGAQIGATVSQLGSTGFYFLRSEGYATSRDQGDAFTTNPATEYNTSLSPPSTDVHQISYANASEPSDATLPDRGGFNYRITLPAGGRIQVYNAAFAPESTHNFCENAKTGTAGHTCSSGDPYYYHEDDSFGSTPWPSSQYSAMRYTIYQVPNLFIRSSDVKQTQMTVYPIDASNATASPPTYKDIGTGATITQTYNAAGAPTNMKIYHSWIDVATYTEAGAGDLVVYNASYGASPELFPRAPTGSASTRWSGTVEYPTRAAARSPTRVTRCARSTPQALSARPARSAPGMTRPFTRRFPAAPSRCPSSRFPPITPDRRSPSTSSTRATLRRAAFWTLSILTPTGSVATASAPFQVKIYDLGTQRSNLESSTVCSLADPISNPPCLAASGSTATMRRTEPTSISTGTGSTSYSPSRRATTRGLIPTTGGGSFSTRRPGTTANDTFSMAVGFKGNPAHILQS